VLIIYLSGPITGITDRNKKAFSKAAREINSFFKSKNKDVKIKIINPVKMGYKLDEKYKSAGREPPEWEDYMRACIKELCQCDFIYLLYGWDISQGAVFEKFIATRLKIPCAENINDLYKLVTGA